MTTPNQTSYWYTAQVVTALQMTEFSQDLYAKLTNITETAANVANGCILNIGSISQTMGNVTVGAGSFRFPDATYSYLPYNTGIFGNAPSAVVAVTGNGYIVARYVISPNTATQTNYTFATTYVFVTSINPTTDCLICTITSGLISGYGNYFAYTPDINDDVFTGACTIGGRVIGSPQNMITRNTIISGNIPYSQIITKVEGPYTNSELFTTNGITNNYSNHFATYADGGDGNFKPNSMMTVSDPAGYSAQFAHGPSTSTASYVGFISQMQNVSADGTSVALYMGPASSGNVGSAWQQFSAPSTLNNGIQLLINKRPALQGNLTTLGITANSLLAVQDMQSGVSVSVTSGSTTTVTLPYTMTTVNYSIILTPVTTTANTVTGTYYAVPINTTTFTIGNNLTVSMTFNWVAVWNGH